MSTIAASKHVRFAVRRFKTLCRKSTLGSTFRQPFLGAEATSAVTFYRLPQHATFSTTTPTTPPELTVSTSQDELEDLVRKYTADGKLEEAKAAFQQIHQPKEDLLNSIIDAWLDDDIYQKTPSQQYQIVSSASELLQQFPISTKALEDVLTAWANISSQHRGIPQRAQHLLLSHPSQPSTNASNQLLKAWACSHEHLRGTMAEQVFASMNSQDGATYHWIIRAWAWSGEKRSAFTATGHFMRQMRGLEKGQRDMEPTVEDYQIVLETWTRAE